MMQRGTDYCISIRGCGMIHTVGLIYKESRLVLLSKNSAHQRNVAYQEEL